MSDDTDLVLVLTAGDEVTVPAVGSYYRIIEASAVIWVAIDDGPLVKRYQGMGQGRSAPFSRLRLKSDSNQTVHVAVTDGRVDDLRLSLTTTVQTNEDQGSNINATNATVGTGAAVLVNADATRRSLYIWNNSATATVYVGGSAGTVTTGNGWPIPPMSGLSLDRSARAGVYAIASAAGVDVRVLSEHD